MMINELEFLFSILRDHLRIAVLIGGALLSSHVVTGFIGFLIDKGPALHRAANVLRWFADVLDRTPKVAVDLKAGDIGKALKDASGDNSAVVAPKDQ